MDVRFCEQQEPTAERHTCELRILKIYGFARSSAARSGELFFLLTKTYMDVGKPDVVRLAD